MYATIRERSGRENLRDEQVEHRGGMEVEIYHPRGGTFPSVQHRIQWTEWDTGTVRTANIDHVGRVTENRKRLILYCTEVQS